MSGEAIDTNVAIAALLEFHAHNGVAAPVVERLRKEGALIIPGPVIVEVYATLTRMPPPYRIAPKHAAALIDDLVGEATAIALTAKELWHFVRKLPTRDVSGGRSYGAHIVAAAEKADATTLWTFNVEHFAPLASPSLSIKQPH